MITGNKYRISVLTDRIIRLEYSESGSFEDRPTFAVVDRSFWEKEGSYSLRDEEGLLQVDTGELLLTYDKKPFSSFGLSIEVRSTGKKWNYGDSYGFWTNLGGTARTLDDVDGRIRLEDGIFGRDGYAVIDDSKTPVLENGEFVGALEDHIDIYFFGYGKDYYAGLRDFCRLCGNMPMVPRYALGNWWSRYYKYTEESYMKVVDSFAKEGIPLSVAVIDMDWHVTEVDPKYGTGWTGYTWNKDMFPDYKRFLRRLHENKLAVTLNLHPADGIRAFEDMYGDIAKELGIDSKSKAPAEFDFGDKAFRDAYFKCVMHPYEKDGVDFWWIDWQQGTGKKASDVDPLLLLNHYHYEDQEKRNLRPMIFSRYAGVGSHRYPVGFSGDSHATWKSLNFQPYFTSTASNIGYGMWSHDIGGHMLGDKDLERLVRWIQYGVFSPVMRIHSSSSAFFNKEPWNLEEPYRSIVKKFMVLRHRMIPYLYTENHRGYAESKPLIRPMYYDYSGEAESYNVLNQYGFGDSLLVCAITEPEDRELKLACSRGYIPKGRWYDIFNGYIYEGPKVRKFYRELSELPVLLKAGGIVPLTEGECQNGTDNPSNLCILVGAGADGSYTLYEDDGCSMNYRRGEYVETQFATRYDAEVHRITFTISAAKGEGRLIPSKRSYKLKLIGAVAEGYEFDKNAGATIVEVGEVDVSGDVTVEIEGVELLSNDYMEQGFRILERAWINTETKDVIYDKMLHLDKATFGIWLRQADISEKLKDAFYEIGV
ncbi:glycoside hydrolase family 31 protein [Butyrivibrio sp. DSM 10294]|uniref:glycoside hydrolase family 31 protein n=1 Tax=Butyrivibrio sp. DSM 10294 TaxID=2972457 RepID=UPI00234EF685|nr:glycoside hydrolase family 31 protein [Butyrivibrio sp. DSM 10294]MDC7294550.1 glycoside hydrolase family 31 protein [Butyrivibrio sp. DSM 10294]